MAQVAPQLGFVVAVAVAAAVDRLAGPGTTLKWPNDVMRGGAKLAGILLERLQDGAVLAGIGMNVQHAPPGLPYAVTSLSALGCTADPEAIIAALASTMAAEWALWRADGFGHTLERWMARGPRRGARLTIRQGGAPLTGPLTGPYAGAARRRCPAAGPARRTPRLRCRGRAALRSNAAVAKTIGC